MAEEHHHQIWLKLVPVLVQVQVLLRRAVAEDATIDDLDWLGRRLIQYLFQPRRDGLIGLNLGSLHVRIAKGQDAERAGRLGIARSGVAEAQAVDVEPN